MSGSPSVVDFFAIEAAEYLDRIDHMVAGTHECAPDADALARTARALRGSASMARQTELAELAGAIEGTALAVRAGAPWSDRLADAVTAAADEFRALLRSTRSWGAGESERSRRRIAELRGLAPAPTSGAAGAASGPARAGTAPARIVPVATLFHGDGGPHVVHRAAAPPITADQRFRQAAVPLASTLRRLVGDARRALAADPGDGGEAARRSVGEDLRGALRDLRELAESYGIAPVVNFAAAREEPLGRLVPHALDTVDAAAGALIESAGAAWARATPPAGSPGVRPAPAEETVDRRDAGSIASSEAPPPPTPTVAPVADASVEARPAPRDTGARVGVAADAAATPSPVEPPPPRTPPTGQALVALLESGITGISRLGASPLDGDPAAGEAGANGHAPRAEADDRPIVGIETLVYRGRAALDRARAVRDALRATPAPPDPTLLAELYDLLDLATDD